jgi:CheY-like chemotaxis protein
MNVSTSAVNIADATDSIAEQTRLGGKCLAALVSCQSQEGNGLAVAKAIRANPATAEVKLIMMSSMARRLELARLGAPEADGWLIKPVKVGQLQRCLVEILAHAPEGPLAADPSSVHSPQFAQAHPGHILLAEDNRVNQIVALNYLRRLGYQADCASDGLEAIKTLSQKHYDLILMDCQMPLLDGYEAARRIRASEPPGRRIRIIALTANAMQGDRDTCLAAGMDDYLSKPVRLENLKACLARHLRPTEPIRSS